MASKTFAEIWSDNGIVATDVWIHTAELSNGSNVSVNGLLLPSLWDLETTPSIPVSSEPSTDFPFFYTNDNFIKVIHRLAYLFEVEDCSHIVGVLISATEDLVAIVRRIGSNPDQWEAHILCTFHDTIQTFMSRLRNFRPDPDKIFYPDLTTMDHIENPGTWEWQGTTESRAEDAIAAQGLYQTYFGIQVRQPWNDSKVYSVR